MVLGFIKLAILSTLVLAVALAVCVRAQIRSRAECGVAASVVGSLLVLIPIYVLGFLNRLTGFNLAIGSVVLSTATLVVACIGYGPLALVRGVGRSAWGLMCLPYEALRATWRARSPTWIGVVASLGVIVWTVWGSYLAASDSWNGMQYHETIVGFVLQNRGFRLVAIPDALAQVNSFPRNCEMINLWFVIFADRTFIEVSGSLYSIPLMLSVYVIVSRYARDRVIAIGCACLYFLLPAVFLQLRSTAADIQVLALSLASLHFATKPDMRLRDGWLAAASIGLLLGTTYSALVGSLLMACTAAGYLAVGHLRKRPWATLATVAGVAAVICALGAIVYCRNWAFFHNPVWPLAVNWPKLKVHWPGIDSGMPATLHQPFVVALQGAEKLPMPWTGWFDGPVFGYGLIGPFVFVPLGLLATAILVVASGYAFVRRMARGGVLPEDRETIQALMVTVAGCMSALAFSGLGAPRCNLQWVASILVPICWLSARTRAFPLGEGVCAIGVVTGMMWIHWANPAWLLGWAQAKSLAKVGRERRAMISMGNWGISAEAAQARERELGPGDVVAFNDDCPFPAVLWNQRFSNRLVYVPLTTGGAEYMGELDSVHAKWVIARSGTNVSKALSSSSSWQIVEGPVARQPFVQAFRRVSRPADGSK